MTNSCVCCFSLRILDNCSLCVCCFSLCVCCFSLRILDDQFVYVLFKFEDLNDQAV